MKPEPGGNIEVWVNVPQGEIKVGVPGYSRPENNQFLNALTMPFRKQRDYWEGTVEPEREAKGRKKTLLAE